MLYGFDTESKCFYVTDNINGGKYSHFKCSFDEFDNATKGLVYTKYERVGQKESIELLSFYNEDRIGFDLERVKESIADYLLCRQTVNWYTESALWKPEIVRNRTYGLDCYNVLQYHIEYALEHYSLHFGWIHVYHLFWEHKKIMLLRLQYMLDNNYLNISQIQTTINNYKELGKSANICLNLLLKYRIVNNADCLNKVSNLCMQMKSIEESTLWDLLEKIDEKYASTYSHQQNAK